MKHLKKIDETPEKEKVEKKDKKKSERKIKDFRSYSGGSIRITTGNVIG